MDIEQQRQWCESKADELVEQADISVLAILPIEMQLAIKALAHQAFYRGYGWGFNDGRIYSGTGREPNYHVTKPLAENIAKPHNAASAL